MASLQNGQQPTPRTEDVPVGFDEEGNVVCVRLTAPGLLTLQAIQKEIQEPKPPPGGKALRDDKGNPRTDAQGCVITEGNPEDPDYLEAVSRANLAKAVCLILLTAGENITVDVKREDFPSAADYYVAAWEECERDLHFNAPTFQRLATAARGLARVDEVEIKEIEEELEGKAEPSVSAGG